MFGVFFLKKMFIVIGCWLLFVIPRLFFVVCCLFASGRWLLRLLDSCLTVCILLLYCWSLSSLSLVFFFFSFLFVCVSVSFLFGVC